MADFLLRPKAIADLDSIWSYTIETWGEEQAEHYLRQLNDAFHDVARNPKVGRSCDGIRAGYCRVSVGRHIIFFRTTDTGVDIVRVLHQRMDVDRHF